MFLPQGYNPLPALPGGNRQRSMADILAETMAAQRQFDEGQALRSRDYVQDSGLGGALLMGLQGFLGGRQADKAEKQLADLLRERFDAENAQSAKAAQAQMEKEDRDYQRELEKIDRQAEARAKSRPKDWKAGIIESLSPEQQRQAAMIDLGLAPRAGSGPGPSEAPAAIRELQAYLALSPEEQKTFDRLQGREVGQAQLSAKDQQAQQLRGVSAEQAETLVGQLEGLTKEGVGGPIAGRLPGSSVFNPDIERYETVRAQLVDEITRLRRVPGIGAQSDLELRTALAAIPGVETNEATRRQAFDNLRQVISRVREELGQRPGTISGKADATSGKTGDPLIDRYL